MFSTLTLKIDICVVWLLLCCLKLLVDDSKDTLVSDFQ